MRLSNHQIQILEQSIEKFRIKDQRLKEEIIDHLYSVTEHEYKGEISLENFAHDQINQLAPQGLKNLEKQITFINNPNMYIMTKITYFLGFLATLSLAMGTMFKLMHWPGANKLLFTGFISVFALFLPYLGISKLVKETALKKLDRARIIIGVICSIALCVSVVFKHLHLQGASIIFVLSMCIFMFAFLPLFFVHLYKESEHKKLTVN